MATNTGLLDNPNAASQAAPGQAQGQSATQAAQPTPGAPAQQTNKPMDNTVATKPAGTGNPIPGAQSVTPKPGDKPLMIQDQVQEYEKAFGFDPATMTVEGRLQGLMDSDNALIQRSRDRAQLESTSRGLRNSSIAVQAGEEAAYSAALPIAQADAQNALAVRTAAFGAAVEDQMMQKQHDFDLIKIEQAYQNDRGLAEQTFGFNTELADQSHGHRMAEGKQAGEFQLGAAQIGAAAQVASANISASASRDNAQLAADSAMERQESGQEFSASESALAREEAATARAQQDAQFNKQLDTQVSEGVLSRDHAKELAEMQVDSNQKNNALSSITNVISATENTIANIMASNPKNAADAVREAEQRRDRQIDAVIKMTGSSGQVDFTQF